MINLKKFALIGAIVVMGLFLMNGATAQPTVEILSVEPEEPTVDSDFTVTANFSWDNISSVVMYVDLCSEDLGLCFDSLSTVMTETGGDYSGTVTIKDSRTTYVTYRFDITAEGQTYSLMNSSWKVNLKQNIDNGNNGGSTSTDNRNNGTPGFELLFLLVALSTVVYIAKRKR